MQSFVIHLHYLVFLNIMFIWLLFKRLEFSKTLFIKVALNWSKVTVKSFKMLQNISISNKWCSFELSIHQIMKNTMYQFPQKYSAAQLFSTLIAIKNISWTANQHIRMISDGLCDTEAWSNDAENSALITTINCFTIYSHIKQLF